MKLIIGLVGENGAGKETVGNLLIEALQKLNYTVARQHFSDILKKTLVAWGIETTRANLQKLPQVMDGAYGPGTLTRAVKRQLETETAAIVIADGVRWLSDEEMIRDFHNYTMVYVAADPTVRYRRLKARKEKAGEEMMTYEQFLKESNAPNEVRIAEIGARAHFQLENNGTLEELEQKVTEMLDKEQPNNPAF